MKPARAWKDDLAATAPDPRIVVEPGRRGKPTLRVGDLYLHSRYDPAREANQLIESAQLDTGRPILVGGLGLGYHVQALRARGAEVFVIEPDANVARAAIVAGPMAGDDTPLWIGDIEAVAQEEEFRKLATRMPQLLLHPPTTRLHPQFADAVRAALARAALGNTHLSVAVVGPMYGGSLPITKYLADAFTGLGHRTLHVDNATGWPLYEATTNSVRNETIQGQLTNMLTNFLGEWSFTRVAEFQPDICIVMAQAPTGKDFAARLRKRGIVTAFWFVENWRHMPYWKQVALEYDYFFHIQPGVFEQELDAIGCVNHAFVQTGCDPKVHRPVDLTTEEAAEYGCHLSFAGAGYPNRNNLFRGLTDYDFKIWGVNWTDPALAPLLQRPGQRFNTEEFMKMVAGATINLNLHASTRAEGVDPKCDAVNPRVFEIAAAGGFQLCDPCLGIENHFDLEHELPTYTDLKSLRAQIDYYLANPDTRRTVAQRAQERALRNHTYTQRAQQMLDHILARHGAALLKRGVKVHRTIGEMAEKVGAHTQLGSYLAQLPPNMLFTHDHIKELLPLGIARDTYPARLFTYMTEVRGIAEKLFKEKR
ncbi:MAG: glycosyltransferase [Candidatus Hydrogenedentota bacterium]